MTTATNCPTCSAPLEGDKALVCSGCHRNSSSCRCGPVSMDCICGGPVRELQNLMKVCAGCGVPPGACKCAKKLHVAETLPAGRKGLFGAYVTEVIVDPRANTRSQR